VVIFFIALDIFYLLFSHNAFVHGVVESVPLVISTELAGRARGLGATEAAHAAVLIDEGIGDARVVSLVLALRARLLLDGDPVLACDLSQRVEVHRARIDQRLIDTISEELSPRRLVELVDREAPGACTGTRPVHIVSECVRFKDAKSHLAHDLVVGLLQDPVSKAVLSRCSTRDEIDVRDRHVRVRVPTVTVKVHNHITRTVRRNLFRQRISSISDDLRRCRIVRVELVSGEALNDHQGLIFATRALEHRLDGSNRVVRVTEVRTPCSRT